MHVTDYVGSGISKKSVSKKVLNNIVDQKKPEKLRWTKDQKNLCRFFYALKAQKVGTFFNAKIFESPRAWSSFHRLAESIKIYERETCTKVDKLLYLGSHLNWFGYDMFPNQLMTSISWNLYQAHERVEKVPLIELSKHDDTIQQFKMLKKLAQERKEPERIVLMSLKSSGLFSADFLKQRGIRP